MARPRRVAFVGNFALWRKATMDSRALPMAVELQAAGHLPSLIVPPWDDPSQSGKRTVVWGVPVRNVEPGAGRTHHARTTLALLRATLAARPDVVVAVKPKAYAGLLALFFASLGRRGARPVRLVVDTDDWEGTGGWNSLTGDPAPVKALVAAHERVALRLADHVTAASRALETLALSVGVDRERLTYIPNATWPGAAGWPSGDGARVRSDLGLGEAPVLLLYSRLFELDLARLLAVLRSVADAVPTVRVLIVGAGLRGEDVGLRAGLADAALADRTALVGFAQRDRIPDLLAAADVALVPMDDTLVNRARCSVKLLDLMLAGRAIVAERVGQVGEYVTDDRTGRLIAPGDAAAMASATIELLNDRQRARGLGQAAAEAARNDFVWPRRRENLIHAIIAN